MDEPGSYLKIAAKRHIHFFTIPYYLLLSKKSDSRQA